MKKINPVSYRTALLGGMALSFLSPVSANAQIEEIVVTAEKRAQLLQDIPLAVSAFSSEELGKAQLLATTDLAGRVPSLFFSASQQIEEEIFIRGIGTARLDSASQDAGVGVFVDGVYIPRRGAGTFEFSDLERIEVLRGPQGTLYGKNVVGGAISLISKKPNLNKLEGKFSGNVGNYNQLMLDGYVSGPLTDKLAAKISGHFSSHGGYGKNINPTGIGMEETPRTVAGVLIPVSGQTIKGIGASADLETREAQAVRGQLLYDGGQGFDVLLGFDYSEDSGSGLQRRAVYFQNDPFLDLFGLTNASLSYKNPDPASRESEGRFPSGFERTTGGVSATINIDTNIGQITSVSAYRWGEALSLNDQLGHASPPGWAQSLLVEQDKFDFFSEEVRLASSLMDGKLHTIVGAYYSREKVDRVDGQISRSATGLASLNGAYEYIQKNITKSFAVFGQADYDVTSWAKFTLGARWTRDEKEYDTRAIDLVNDGTRPPVPLVTPFDVSSSDSWEAFTPRVSFSVTPQKDIMFYLTASRGFKSGGWQGKPANAAAAVVSFDPEFAWNYEIGARTELFDKRLRLNLTAFQIDYSDLQVEQQSTNTVVPTLIVSNAANARSRGLELEARWMPVDALDIWVNASVLDTKFKSFIDSSGKDLSGNELQRAPDHQLNMGFEYTQPIQDSGNLSLRVDFSLQGKFWWAVDGRPQDLEGSHKNVNARITYQNADGDWELSLWGKNLTDELTPAFSVYVFGDKYQHYAPPRTWGVSAQYKF